MTPDAAWIDRARRALETLSEPLLREVVAGLVKPRSAVGADELIERCVGTLTNPPVLDRRIKELPDAPRKLLAVIGLSRRPTWRCGHLVAVSAALGHADGLNPVLALLKAGLLFPETAAGADPIVEFETWLGWAGTLSAPLFVPPAVAARARAEELGLPVLASEAADEPPAHAVRQADGLDWPLRLAAAWQLVGAGSLRMTQVNTLFKRDLGRVQGDLILGTPAPDQLTPVPDAGVLALFWAMHAGLLELRNGELTAGTFPDAWGPQLGPLLVELWGALSAVEGWDPLAGYAPAEPGASPFPTAALLLGLLLARLPADAWIDAGPLAAWLWEHHPSWAGSLPKESAKGGGRDWVEAVLLGLFYSLRLAEVAAGDPVRVRLTALGRSWLAGAPEPPPPPAFPQALLVQPNAEILAYRQGLTPALVALLSRFAQWKGLGPACTLELTPEQTYRGLEGGLTVAGISQVLSRHGMKPVPAPVSDLLRRWADKRERITLFAAATLVEFPTPADLDLALSRGIVAVKLTDRIGMTDGGQDPDFKQLRLIGNRDYEAKPQPCLSVAHDGLTLSVDPAASDLLLEAEIGKFAETLDADGVARRYRLTPESLRRAARHGLTAAELDAWFVARSREPLSPAARMLFQAPTLPAATVSRPVVLEVASEEIADGLAQWPVTAPLILARLGPTALAVEEGRFAELKAALEQVGWGI